MVNSMVFNLSFVIQTKLEKQRAKLEESRRMEIENRHKPTDTGSLRFYEATIKLLLRNTGDENVFTEKKIYLLGTEPEQKRESGKSKSQTIFSVGCETKLILDPIISIFQAPVPLYVLIIDTGAFSGVTAILLSRITRRDTIQKHNTDKRN